MSALNRYITQLIKRFFFFSGLQFFFLLIVEAYHQDFSLGCSVHPKSIEVFSAQLLTAVLFFPVSRLEFIHASVRVTRLLPSFSLSFSCHHFPLLLPVLRVFNCLVKFHLPVRGFHKLPKPHRYWQIIGFVRLDRAIKVPRLALFNVHVVKMFYP